MAFDSRDNDDFWNIESLIPKKKKKLTPFASPTVVTHTAGGSESDDGRTRLTLTGRGEVVDETYTPEGYAFIKEVGITRISDKYDFYDNFRKAALLYYDVRGEKCDFTHFYSYMPQYSQLTMAQKSYYFYFRDSIRRGRYIRSDVSYVYLYAYEILNLPDRIEPTEGLKLLVDLWRAYRKDLPMLDNTLPLWIQDYCLVHKLPCPAATLGDSLRLAMAVSPLCEFFFSSDGFDSEESVEALVAHLSDYDWRTGRFSSGEEARAVFTRHVDGAMRTVFKRLMRDGRIETGENLATLKRDAFARSLCTHKVKCKLTVKYIALSVADDLRTEITAAVRYTENRIRAVLGIKSRLGVKGLPDSLKREIDAYFERCLMPGGSLAPRIVVPEYERLYAAPEEKLSLAGADEIERASWSTTLRLVEYGEDAPTVSKSNTDEPLKTDIPDSENAPSASSSEGNAPRLSREALAALRLAYDGSYGGGDGLRDDNLAEQINEFFADTLGDVVLDFDGESYRIIDDYKEDVEEWIR